MSIRPLDDRFPLVRPYAMTGGRTRARENFAIEALVISTPLGALEPSGLAPECREICELCRETRSVAEVGALLRLPLGVVRVLVGDLVDAGMVTVHQATIDDQPEVALLERVLSGLRRI